MLPQIDFFTPLNIFFAEEISAKSIIPLQGLRFELLFVCLILIKFSVFGNAVKLYYISFLIGKRVEVTITLTIDRKNI